MRYVRRYEHKVQKLECSALFLHYRGNNTQCGIVCRENVCIKDPAEVRARQ